MKRETDDECLDKESTFGSKHLSSSVDQCPPGAKKQLLIGLPGGEDIDLTSKLFQTQPPRSGLKFNAAVVQISKPV